MITDQDRHDVAAWRGLDAAVLRELDVVAAGAIRRDYQAAAYAEAVRSRAACLRLRAEHGLGIREKLKRTQT